jgi:hypothetical protein
VRHDHEAEAKLLVGCAFVRHFFRDALQAMLPSLRLIANR